MRNDNHNDSNNTQWEQELIARIAQIEENSRDIKIMTKKDYIVAGIIITVCLLFVIAGAFMF